MKKLFILMFGFFFYLSSIFSQDIWVLNNGDPDDFSPPFDDRLKLFDSNGTQLMVKSGFNTGEIISGRRILSVTNDGNFCWVSEYFTDKLSKIDKNGNAVLVINKNIGAIDQTSNGNLYALGKNYSIDGDSIFVFDRTGNILRTEPYGGFDLVVDERNNAVWIVGTKIHKLSLALNHIFTIDPLPWTGLTVDFSIDGSIWVGEGEHPDVFGSKNRILHISKKGIVQKSIQVSNRPQCIRVNRQTDIVWIASKNLVSLNPNTSNLKNVALGGFTLTIDRNDNIWIANEDNVRKYSDQGVHLLTIDGFQDKAQKHISTIKNFSLTDLAVPVAEVPFFQIFPNPVSNILKVNLNTKQIENRIFTIRDLHGRLLYSTISTESKITIETNFLDTGLYALSIQSHEGFYTKKVQIVN